MQQSTPSPSAAMQSTNNDCVASQYPTINETTAQTHMLPCGRAGCPVVFVYGDGTDWPTVSRLINDHSPVCRGGFYGLNHAPPRSNTQQALMPAQLAPKSIAGGRKRRKKEDERKQELEDDEYTEDVQPTSVTCRECQKAITIDKRSRYYPGLWLKHRGKCPGIRKIEVS
ncbi:uncharacterized protein EDB93DRAFT_1134344 [Suillus bovinus]|uniref:uncharacterized protein n=1 Tax=Suillus bovinus TaxID=48563 RepID=UPI001B871520|nr:uncharacterized protein EDB93DRAFT_1134344 [Suillus bovinus]KAG2153727.1 hypothetical protein EDB93DRAFT_1134344 [Suillus bovinus]